MPYARRPVKIVKRPLRPPRDTASLDAAEAALDAAWEARQAEQRNALLSIYGQAPSPVDTSKGEYLSEDDWAVTPTFTERLATFHERHIAPRLSGVWGATVAAIIVWGLFGFPGCSKTPDKPVTAPATVPPPPATTHPNLKHGYPSFQPTPVADGTVYVVSDGVLWHLAEGTARKVTPVIVLREFWESDTVFPTADGGLYVEDADGQLWYVRRGEAQKVRETTKPEKPSSSSFVAPGGGAFAIAYWNQRRLERDRASLQDELSIAEKELSGLQPPTDYEPPEPN